MFVVFAERSWIDVVRGGGCVGWGSNFSIEIFVRKNRSAALVLGRFLVNIFFTVPG